MKKNSGTTKAILILLAIGIGIVLLIYAYPLVLGGLAVYAAWFLIKMQQKNKVIATIVISILALVWFGYFVSNKNKPGVAGVETKQETKVEKKEATPTLSPSTAPTSSSASAVQETATPQPATPASNSGFTCGSKTKCGEMTSCEEAKFYLNNCGLSRLDGDKDGIPCESLCK